MDKNAQIMGLLNDLPRRPWREVMVEHALMLGIAPQDVVELRLRSTDRDYFKLAQRAVDAFFSAFSLYPQTLAVHPSIAGLFEASELMLKAEHQLGKDYSALILRDFAPPPIGIETDVNLDVNTVAVRFSLAGEEWREAIKTSLVGILSRVRESRGEP